MPGNTITVRTRPGKAKELERYTVERCSLVGKLTWEKGAQGPREDQADAQADAASAAAEKASHRASVEGQQQQTQQPQQTNGNGAGAGAEVEPNLGAARLSSAEVSEPQIRNADEVDKAVKEAHFEKVEKLLKGVEMDDDL